MNKKEYEQVRELMDSLHDLISEHMYTIDMSLKAMVDKDDQFRSILKSTKTKMGAEGGGEGLQKITPIFCITTENKDNYCGE